MYLEENNQMLKDFQNYEEEPNEMNLKNNLIKRNDKLTKYIK